MFKFLSLVGMVIVVWVFLTPDNHPIQGREVLDQPFRLDTGALPTMADGTYMVRPMVLRYNTRNGSQIYVVQGWRESDFHEGKLVVYQIPRGNVHGLTAENNKNEDNRLLKVSVVGGMMTVLERSPPLN